MHDPRIARIRWGAWPAAICPMPTRISFAGLLVAEVFMLWCPKRVWLVSFLASYDAAWRDRCMASCIPCVGTNTTCQSSCGLCGESNLAEQQAVAGEGLCHDGLLDDARAIILNEVGSRRHQVRADQSREGVDVGTTEDIAGLGQRRFLQLAPLGFGARFASQQRGGQLAPVDFIEQEDQVSAHLPADSQDHHCQQLVADFQLCADLLQGDLAHLVERDGDQPVGPAAHGRRGVVCGRCKKFVKGAQRPVVAMAKFIHRGFPQQVT